MDRKKVGIAIIIFGALSLIGIVYVLFFHKFTADLAPVADVISNGNSETAKIRPTEIDARNVSTIPQKPEVKKAGQAELEQIAYSFAERFGSYSNQSTYQNMLDLKTVMTSKMSSWVDNYVQDQITSKKDTSTYSGITTKTVSVKLLNYKEGDTKAIAEVSTQRREATGNNNNASSYGQILKITFLKEGKDWKVDEARWATEKLK